MEKIGFIGYGAMGSMIIRGILQNEVFDQSQMIITTRTLSKLEELKKSHPELEIAQNNVDVAKKSRRIFLFVNTGMVTEVIDEIIDYISDKTHIIYIAAGLTMENVERTFDGKVSKVIPSLTSEVNQGISLVAHNQQVNYEDAKFVENVFKSISEVKLVTEDKFGLGADLTSCSPAFIASIMLKFSQTATKRGIFSDDEVREMVTSTLYGTAKLLCETDLSFEDVMLRVATPGGITEEGLKVLDTELPDIFDKLFETTLNKYVIVEKEINKK